MNIDTFWALIKNDLELRKHAFRRRWWWKLYVIIFSLIALTGYFFALQMNLVRPQYFLFFLPYLLFISFGIAIRHIRQEWRGQTVGWWLTLPYPKAMLLAVKFASAFLRLLLILFRFLFIGTFLGVISMVIKPEIWNLQTILPLLQNGARLTLLLILASPAVITFGLNVGILIQSRWRVLLPFLMFVGISLATALLNNIFHLVGFVLKPNEFVLVPQLVPLLSLKTFLLLGIGLPGLVAGCLFALAAYLLEQQTEV